MRRCPCCGALAFEDIDTCYECMHPLNVRAGGPGDVVADDTLRGRPPASSGPVGRHVRASGAGPSSRRGARQLDALGDVYCYSIDSSLEAPAEEGRGADWSIEMEQPGVPGKSVSLGSSHPAVSIGRSRDNDLVIMDMSVSRHHARIELAEDALWARDLDSRNLTYLDGVPLLGAKRLVDGAELRIGAARLHVSRASPPSATAAAP